MNDRDDNQKIEFGIHIGTASLLLLFIVLALVCFAALTLSNALSERSLTDRAAEKTSDYYSACADANKALRELDLELCAAYKQGMTEADYFETFGETQSFSFAVSDTQTLEVTVQITYPEIASDTFYTITQWREVLSDSDSTDASGDSDSNAERSNLLF